MKKDSTYVYLAFFHSAFTQYNYPGIYESQDFHYCGLEPGNNIENWDNPVEVYTCQLDGLAEWVLHHLSNILKYWH